MCSYIISNFKNNATSIFLEIYFNTGKRPPLLSPSNLRAIQELDLIDIFPCDFIPHFLNKYNAFHFLLWCLCIPQQNRLQNTNKFGHTTAYFSSVNRQHRYLQTQMIHQRKVCIAPQCPDKFINCFHTMPTHKDPNGDSRDTECFSITRIQQLFMANLRNSVIYNSYFLTYTTLTVNSNITRIYSCVGTNPSLAYILKDWSDICCFTCSFRNKILHLAAILIKQMPRILTPKSRTQMHSLIFLSKCCYSVKC